MINSEKDLEDYICNNQEKFIYELNKIFGAEKEINFLGRQVKIGSQNIADLVYYIQNEKSDIPWETGITYIIVELKYRNLEPKDLAQLQRYKNTLETKLTNEHINFNHIYGVFVSFGENPDMQEICMASNISDLYFISINTEIKFNHSNWSYNSKYIKDLILDERLIKNNNKIEKENE